MRHGYHKPKFKTGKDANDMLMRKLAVNFITRGSMVTSEKKAKTLRPFVERIVQKAKGNTQADKNYLLRYFPQVEYITLLTEQIAPALKEMSGGYVRVIRLNQRDSDGTVMSRIEWAHPVVVNAPVKEEKKEVKTESKEEVKEAKKAKS